MIIDRQVANLVIVGEVLDEGGSLTEVANRINRTQPAISFSIKNIEDRLGFKLINRSNNGKRVKKITLTEKGRDFISKVKGLCEQEASIMAGIKNV